MLIFPLKMENTNYGFLSCLKDYEIVNDGEPL